ncbi:hypothetical protein L211DRAFT_59641 [Terfezia boudieri ATCC MYA-4762]|uniref:Uncharacterized protein n=1 Tax=Terfezia boudieri ATCC MYA-4762 TaxID=1051890 RepID=A0A3N4LXF1_9PEZI|nr:hypothetical protein L211DRAFT_59641 [Terfezia boudieri ATCC MYA-4762]
MLIVINPTPTPCHVLCAPLPTGKEKKRSPAKEKSQHEISGSQKNDNNPPPHQKKKKKNKKPPPPQKKKKKKKKS